MDRRWVFVESAQKWWYPHANARQITSRRENVRTTNGIVGFNSEHRCYLRLVCFPFAETLLFLFFIFFSLCICFSLFFCSLPLSVSVLHILCKCTEISLDLSKVNAIMCFGIFGFGVHRFRAIFSGIVVSHFGAFGRALHVWMRSSPLKSTMHIAHAHLLCVLFILYEKKEVQSRNAFNELPHFDTFKCTAYHPFCCHIFDNIFFLLDWFFASQQIRESIVTEWIITTENDSLGRWK